MDIWACANLIPISVYSRLFDKTDRDLKSTVDHRVKLIAANNKEIRQLGTVNLRVKAEDREEVCRFYVVPDSCGPILGLPDLKRMDLVQFKVPTTSQWTDYVSSIAGRQVPIFSYFFLFFSAYSYFSYFLAISSYFSYFLVILLFQTP